VPSDLHFVKEGILLDFHFDRLQASSTVRLQNNLSTVNEKPLKESTKRLISGSTRSILASVYTLGMAQDSLTRRLDHEHCWETQSTRRYLWLAQRNRN
jgi:hypothetical protein